METKKVLIIDVVHGLKILCIATFAVFIFLAPTSQAIAAGACGTPIAYSIGSIDPRFGITRLEFIQYLQQGEKVWEEPAKRDLFTYVAMGGVKVSLAYDSRQSETDKDKATIAKLKLINTTFDVIHERFTVEASSTAIRQERNSKDFVAYKTDESAYNADVAAANARGGASESELRLLSAREIDLRSRFAVLKNEQDAINDYVRRMNTLSLLLNQLASSVNGYINRYNASLAARGEHEAGVYMQDGDSRSITVYEFANSDKLVRTLAHELGHSLGLQHVQDDKDSIMFASNLGIGLMTTPADLLQFESVCGR